MTELEARNLLKRTAAELTDGDKQFCLILQRDKDYLLIERFRGDKLYGYVPAKAFSIEGLSAALSSEEFGFRIAVDNTEGSSKRLYKGNACWRDDRGDNGDDNGGSILITTTEGVKNIEVNGSALDYLLEHFKDGDYLKIIAPAENIRDIIEHKRRVHYDQILKGG